MDLGELGLKVTSFSAEETSPRTINDLTKPKGDVDHRKVVEALYSLPQEYCDDRNKWMKVGLALFNTDPGLLDTFTRWSQQSEKHEDGCCHDLFSSFEGGESDDRITIGSVYHWAGVVQQPKFQTFQLNELLSGNFMVRYRIDGILVDGQPAIFAGPPKSMKTSLALNMGLHLAAGEPFLGRETTKSRVMFMSGESGLPTLQDAARRMLKTMNSPDDGQFYLSPDLPRFDRPLDHLEQLLTELETQVLFIDPAYLCMSGLDAGNLFQMGQQLGAIAKLCTKLGITLVLLHHTTKKASHENKPLKLADMAWSGFAEFARQWLLVSRRKSYRDGSGSHQLYLLAGGSAGHSNVLHVDIEEGTYPSRHWMITGKSNAERRADEKDEKYKECVAKVKAAVNEPMAKTRIRDAASIRSSNFEEVFERMLNDRILKQDGKRKGYPLYSLIPC